MTSAGIGPNLAAVGRAPQALEHLSIAQSGRQLAVNSVRVMAGVTHNMMLNPKLMTRNSLILSTLILVLSRIGIAFQSANKAKGTPDAAFRQKEAIKTTIREAGGWTLTYGFFRGVENLTRKAMRDYFGIEKQTFGLGLRDLGREFGRALRREKSPFNGVKPIEMVDNYQFNFTQKARYQKLDGTIEKLFKTFRLSKETFADDAVRQLSRLKGLYKWVPVIVGTVPTVILSGVILERYTRDHADEMADKLAGKLHGHAGPSGQNGGAQANGAFSAFMSQVNAQQQQRLR